jgi:hypothetical protein
VCVEWYWRCKFERWVLKVLAVAAAGMSLLVVWSEAVFFNVRISNYSKY